MGLWARLTALAAVAGTGLAVVSGAAGWDTAHRVLAAVALPPLAALAAIAWVRPARLLPAALTSLVLFGLAALLTGPTSTSSQRRLHSPRPRTSRLDLPRPRRATARCATT